MNFLQSFNFNNWIYYWMNHRLNRNAVSENDNWISKRKKISSIDCEWTSNHHDMIINMPEGVYLRHRNYDMNTNNRDKPKSFREKYRLFKRTVGHALFIIRRCSQWLVHQQIQPWRMHSTMMKWISLAFMLGLPGILTASIASTATSASLCDVKVFPDCHCNDNQTSIFCRISNESISKV